MENQNPNTPEGETTHKNTNPNYGPYNMGDVPPDFVPKNKEDKMFDDTDFTPQGDVKKITIPENLDHKTSKTEHGGCF